MISSMTGFASKKCQQSWGTVSWEMRSVNHRFLDVSMRLPDMFRSLESRVREALQKKLQRGKVDVYLKFQPGEDMPFTWDLNHALVDQLAAAASEVSNKFNGTQVDVTSVLSWPGVLQKQETAMDAVMNEVMTLLNDSIDELCASRQREGDGLAKFMQQRLNDIRQQVIIVEKRLPLVTEAFRAVIVQKFEDLKISVEAERIEQEMVWVVQKMDVAEEMQRLSAHLSEVERVLEKGGLVGRRLDFLMQELNREANTLASKSSDVQLTQAAVEMKVQIEQMREQVQNIE